MGLQLVFLVCISFLREGGLVASVMEVFIKNLPRPGEAARNGNVKQGGGVFLASL